MAKTEIARTRAHEIRLAWGLRQAEAARRMGVGAATILKVEKVIKGNGISRAMAPKMSKVYQVEIKELYAPLGSPIPPVEAYSQISAEVDTGTQTSAGLVQTARTALP